MGKDDVKAFREEQAVLKIKRAGKEVLQKFTQAEIDALLPPHLWEYREAPWLFGLCIKIFDAILT